MNRVTGCVNGNVRCNLNAVADFDFAYVQNNEVVICKEPLSDFNVVAVIAVEGSLNVNPVACFSQDFPDEAVFFFLCLRRKVVVFENLLFVFKTFFFKTVQP